MQVTVEGKPIRYKKLLAAFFKYKWQNLFILLTALFLGFVYYYFSKPLYRTFATVEVQKRVGSYQEDLFGNLSPAIEGIETEIDILKANFLLKETISHLSMDVRYFQKEYFKLHQLYSDTPFLVKNIAIVDDILYGKKFRIVDLGKNRFKLMVQKGLKERLWEKIPFLPQKESLSLSQIFEYGKPIVYKNSHFTIEKVKSFQDKEYYFSLLEPSSVLFDVKNHLFIQPASFKSYVLKLTYEDRIAKRAKDFLDTYLHLYLEYSKKNMLKEQTRTLAFINEQLSVVSKKLKLSEASLQSYKKDHKIADVKTQTVEAIRRLNQINEEYQSIELEYNVVKVLIKEIKEGNYAALGALSKNYPILNNLVDRLQKLYIEKEKIDTLFTQEHPDTKRINASVAKTQKAIKEVAKGIYDRVIKERQILRKVIHKYKAILESLPQKEIELKRYKNLFNINDKIYNFLLQKQSELSLQKASIVPNKHILDAPEEPKKPFSPKLGVILSTSLFLGFLTTLLLTFLRARKDTKIKSLYDIQEISKIPVYGKIPYIHNNTKYNKAYVLDNPQSKESEAIRAIRNNLEYIVTPNKAKVILVTSSVPNEGKTTFAANLGALLGMGEQKAIILSLDLRKPELHYKFGIPNKVGMSDILSNKTPLQKAIWTSEYYKNFSIITSGKIPPNPGELLASKRMGEVIESLRQSYDYIVLDTPPLHFSNDTLALMKFADITLFVVKSEFSEQKYIEEINTLVESLHIKNAGFILNSLKEKYDTSTKLDYSYIYHSVD